MGEIEKTARPDLSDLPESVPPGSVVLVEGPVAPVENGLCLQVLHRYATPEDVGVVVTTAAGAEATIADYASITDEDSVAPIGIVDTVSQGQNITAFHREVPTVYTPGPADLARVSVAVDNLDAQLASRGGSHLVVRSVAPFFDGGDPAVVARQFDRTFGRWSEDGLLVVGTAFTAVDPATMEALTALADAVVQVAATDLNCPRLEYRPTSPPRVSDHADGNG